MNGRQLGHALAFDELPVGACFAFSPSATRATGKKTGSRTVLAVPSGSVSTVNPNVPVRVMPCRGGLSGARRRRRR